MKKELWIRSFDSPVNGGKHKALLLDSSVLIGICHGGIQPPGIEKLMTNGRELSSMLAVYVPDFIETEAYNAERFHHGTAEVHKLIKATARSSNGFFVGIKTPIDGVYADKRGKSLNLLCKKDRHIILEKYPELSGTDLSLLAISSLMRDSGFEVTLCSSDKELVEAAELLEVATKCLFTHAAS